MFFQLSGIVTYDNVKPLINTAHTHIDWSVFEHSPFVRSKSSNWFTIKFSEIIDYTRIGSSGKFCDCFYDEYQLIGTNTLNT